MYSCTKKQQVFSRLSISQHSSGGFNFKKVQVGDDNQKRKITLQKTRWEKNGQLGTNA